MPRAPNLAPQEALLLVGPRLWHRFNTARIPLDYMGETVFIPPLLLGDRPGPPAAGHTTWPLWRHGARRQQEHGTHCWGSAAKERGKERETQRVHPNENGPAPARPTARLPALEGGQNARAESLRARAKRQQPALRRRLSPQNAKPEPGQGLRGAYFHTSAIVLLMRKGN